MYRAPDRRLLYKQFSSPVNWLLALSLLIIQLYWTEGLQDDPFSKLVQTEWHYRLGYICVRKTISIMLNYKDQSWSYLTRHGVHQSIYSNPSVPSKVSTEAHGLTHTHTHTHTHNTHTHNTHTTYTHTHKTHTHTTHTPHTHTHHTHTTHTYTTHTHTPHTTHTHTFIRK